MKKLIYIIEIAVLVLFMVLGSLYVIDHRKTDSNEPDVFSTCDKKYSPPPEVLEIPSETAIENVKKKLEKKSIETITNLDNPKIEEVIFDAQPSIYLFDDKVNIVGKNLYKITFNTTQDGLLGPMVFYVDKFNGNLIGADYRG
ncbi:MAG: hypothetical protein E7418_02395 [Ruminococcaceae bacterium]|nr:hypothetical protein [Oscillospiraceae bacterium]